MVHSTGGNVIPTLVKLTKGVEHRGGLGYGFAGTRSGGEIESVRGFGKIDDMSMAVRCRLDGFMASSAVAHTRYATNKQLDEEYLHPYVYGLQQGALQQFALVFNGNIPDYAEQRRFLLDEGYHPSRNGDTEIVGLTLMRALNVQLVHNRVDFAEVIGSLGVLDGSCNVIMMMQDGTVVCARNKYAHQSLVRTEHEGIHYIASENSAFKDIGLPRRFTHIPPGEAVVISPNGNVTNHKIWQPERKHCMFRGIYFDSHRSDFEGASIADGRYEGGRILGALDKDRPDSDYLVVVPESSRIGGNGYAAQRHIPRLDIISRDRTVGRTFTAPLQDRRIKAKLKYAIDRNVLAAVKGRAMILFEDSLVRGLTMEVLAEQLKEAGATEIHLRLACPPIIAPCFYGIDFPTVRELLVRKYHSGDGLDDGVLPDEILDALAKDLGVDSVKFLPHSAVPKMLDRKPEELCMACITKLYPTLAGQAAYSAAERDAAMHVTHTHPNESLATTLPVG